MGMDWSLREVGRSASPAVRGACSWLQPCVVDERQARLPSSLRATKGALYQGLWSQGACCHVPRWAWHRAAHTTACGVPCPGLLMGRGQGALRGVRPHAQRRPVKGRHRRAVLPQLSPRAAAAGCAGRLAGGAGVRAPAGPWSTRPPHRRLPAGVGARQEARPAADGHPGGGQPLCRDPGGARRAGRPVSLLPRLGAAQRVCS